MSRAGSKVGVLFGFNAGSEFMTSVRPSLSSEGRTFVPSKQQEAAICQILSQETAMKNVHWAMMMLLVCIGLSGCSVSAGAKVGVGRYKQTPPAEQKQSYAPLPSQQ